MAFKPPFGSIASLSLTSLLVSALATVGILLVTGNATIQGTLYAQHLSVTSTIAGHGTSTFIGVGDLAGDIGISTAGDFGPYGGFYANTQIENDYDANWLMAYRNNDPSYQAGGVTYINYLASCGYMSFSRASSTSPNNVLSMFTMAGIGDQENCTANFYGTKFYSKQGVYFGQGDGSATSTVSPLDSNLVTLGTPANSWKTIVASSTIQGADFFATTSTGGMIFKVPNGTCARMTLSNSFVPTYTTTTCPSL